jgi:hypothetical protein
MYRSILALRFASLRWVKRVRNGEGSFRAGRTGKGTAAAGEMPVARRARVTMSVKTRGGMSNTKTENRRA